MALPNDTLAGIAHLPLEDYGSYQIAQVFTESKAPINSMDFSYLGDILIAANGEHSMNIYHCLEGRYEAPCISIRLLSVLYISAPCSF